MADYAHSGLVPSPFSLLCRNFYIPLQINHRNQHIQCDYAITDSTIFNFAIFPSCMDYGYGSVHTYSLFRDIIPPT